MAAESSDTPTPAFRYLAVDRREGKTLVLVDDDDRDYERPAREHPGVRSGDVLRVPLTRAGRLDWRHATVDDAERERRLDAVKRLRDELAEGDAGGDITL